MDEARSTCSSLTVRSNFHGSFKVIYRRNLFHLGRKSNSICASIHFDRYRNIIRTRIFYSASESALKRTFKSFKIDIKKRIFIRTNDIKCNNTDFEEI